MVTLAQVGEAPAKLVDQLVNGVFLVPPAQGQPLPRTGGSPSPPEPGRGGHMQSHSILREDVGDTRGLTSERRGTWGSAPTLLLVSVTMRSILSRHFSKPMS